VASDLPVVAYCTFRMMLSGMAGLDGELKTLQPLRSSLGFVHALSPNNGAQNFGLQNFWRRYGGDVAIEYDNIRQHSGCDQALFFFGEFCERGTRGIGRDRLVNG